MLSNRALAMFPGKTSLIKRYVHNIAPSKEHHTTIGVEFSLKTLKVEDEIVNVQVWCVLCTCVCD